MKALVPKRKLKTKGRRIPRGAFHVKISHEPTEDVRLFLLWRAREEEKAET